MKSTNVYATTTLYSNSHRAYPYAIHFTVDDHGRVRFVQERGELPIRPFLLLNLVFQVYKQMGLLQSTIFRGLPQAEYAHNEVRHKGPGYDHHPALEVEGKRYRLDHEVVGKWVNNPHIRSMVDYLFDLSWSDNAVAQLCYEYRVSPYTVLDISKNYGWKFCFQP